MDEGPTIAQGAVPVLSDDTAETLAARILTVEHQLYPLTLKLLAEGKVRMDGAKTIYSGNGIKAANNSLISFS